MRSTKANHLGELFTYNPLGRVTQSNANEPVETLVDQLSYLPFGPITHFEYGNGIQQRYAYDLDYRLTDITSTVQDWVYHYDLNSNIEQIVDLADSQHTQTFQYDELNRLTHADGLYGEFSYSYDPVGNRTERTGIIDSTTTVDTYDYAVDANQLAQVHTHVNDQPADTRSFQYTANGQISQDQNNERSHQLTYAEDNRLKTIGINSGSQTVQYHHNALGQRVSKTFDGETTHYVFDLNGKLIAETTADGTLIREYIYLGSQPIALITQAGEPASQHTYFIHNDHLGTPRILTNASQDKVWEIHTTPFGEVHQEIASGVEQLLAFPGQYRDGETGYSYNYYRDYDPSLGRYIQSDPIGLQGGLNTYGYVGGNPLSYIDPKGLKGATQSALQNFFNTLLTGGAGAAGGGNPYYGNDPYDPYGESAWPSSSNNDSKNEGNGGYIDWSSPSESSNASSIGVTTTDICNDEEKLYCAAQCDGWHKVDGCYVTVTWKVKGYRGDSLIKSSQRSVNCNCDDDCD